MGNHNKTIEEFDNLIFKIKNIMKISKLEREQVIDSSWKFF